jgi:8-oxo-dGTP diphosphatase
MKLINVVAAVILKENLYLITKRNRNKHLGLKWEFPGGKVEENESFQKALIREILEELNITIDIKRKVAEEYYMDNKINIKIHYYLCLIKQGSLKLFEHEAYAWVKKQNIYQYDFVIGDKKIFPLI